MEIIIIVYNSTTSHKSRFPFYAKFRFCLVFLSIFSHQSLCSRDLFEICIFLFSLLLLVNFQLIFKKPKIYFCLVHYWKIKVEESESDFAWWVKCRIVLSFCFHRNLVINTAKWITWLFFSIFEEYVTK